MSKDREALIRWATDITSHGTTGFLPSSVSANHRSLVHFLDSMDELSKETENMPVAQILGSRLEGPYINREKAGAHKKDYIRTPSDFEIDDISNFHSSSLRIIDIAPEVSGAMEAIKKLRKKGVVISAGHTNATYLQGRTFADNGVSMATHFYNGMSGFHHRDGGMVGVGLLDTRLKLELITDLKHISPEAISLAVKNRGWDAIILVTDSMAATDLGDGEYMLGDLEVEVSGSSCYLKGTRTLAGSTLTLDRALKNLYGQGYDLKDTVRSATEVPSKLLGLRDRGTLEPGKRADICILDEHINVVSTYVKGKLAFSV